LEADFAPPPSFFFTYHPDTEKLMIGFHSATDSARLLHRAGSPGRAAFV
jgi:hypothetical protein